MNTATILVVDDEPQLRRAVKATLTDLGYSVIDAKTGEEALEMLRGEEAGSAAAEEDGVDGRGKFEAKLLGPVGCGGEVVDEAIDVAGMVAGGVDA